MTALWVIKNNRKTNHFCHYLLYRLCDTERESKMWNAVKLSKLPALASIGQPNFIPIFNLLLYSFPRLEHASFSSLLSFLFSVRLIYPLFSPFQPKTFL